MSVRMAFLPLMLLLMFHRGYGRESWYVNYGQFSICALEGSTVTMTCNYPYGFDISGVFWSRSIGLPVHSQGFCNFGDQDECYSLRISPVALMDTDIYFCTFIYSFGGRWSQIPGVNLTITDLQVESPGRVTEEDSVRLKCKSRCELTDRVTFIWYKNFMPLPASNNKNELVLSPVRSNDAGNYSCGVWEQNYISLPVNLDVRYPPKSVSVSMRGSDRIVEGDSLTLSCNSDSNPSAEIRWYKDEVFVGSEGIFSISQIISLDSGKYKCKAINELGEKYSSPVAVNVMYPPKSVSVSMRGSDRIIEGDSLTLSCNSDSNPSAEIRWYKDEVFVGSEGIFSISQIISLDSGKYKCKAINELGEKYSSPVAVNVMYPPKSVSVSMRGSDRIIEGDSLTLSCNSDSNPSAEIRWYKDEVLVGSEGMFSISQIISLNSGKYKCKAINEHGSKYSDPLTINVMYPPKSVSVSIRGPGEIRSGDSVTLNCSSDSNPPAQNFVWFNGETMVGSGRIFRIPKTSFGESGEYKCRASNKYGGKLSKPLKLNVMHPPGNPVISISPSAVIVEGDSVTLKCRTATNPPPEIIWLKGRTIIGSKGIQHIENISSTDNGEYKCRARNQHGEKYSDPVTLNIMYPPRNVSASFIDSGQIGLTLSCSSDSNPSAEISWFKENQSSAVGSGQSFNAVESGRFYCEAHNPHGSQRSNTIAVTGSQAADMNVVFVVVVAFGGLVILIVIIIIILFLMKRIKRRPSTHEYENDGSCANRYATLDLKSRCSDQYNMLTTVHPRLAVHQLGYSEYENTSQQSNTPI